LSTTSLEARGRALRHALGFGEMTIEPPRDAARNRRRTVLIATNDDALERQVRAAGFIVKSIAFTPFDADTASKIPHFETYNRTAASQRVADIVAAVRANPDAALVASGDAALASLLAAAIAPMRMAILDVGTFDTSSDTDFVERLYIPGLRRAGDLATATALIGERIVIHNAGERFALHGAPVQRTKLGARQIVALLRDSTRAKR
jgi:hypothetical protein